jgi:hypothetical protein
MPDRAPDITSRVLKAAVIGVTNYIVWILVPQLLASRLTGIGDIPLTSNLIITAGVIITGLQVLGALTSGGALAAIFTGGSYVTSAYYLYLATNGGVLRFTVQGITAEISFVTLLMLLMLPSLFNALRVWITYLLEVSEGAHPLEDEVRG